MFPDINFQMQITHVLFSRKNLIGMYNHKTVDEHYQQPQTFSFQNRWCLNLVVLSEILPIHIPMFFCVEYR